MLGLALVALAHGVAAQQIYDIWQTTWDRSPLFEYNPSSAGSLPINFTSSGTTGDADITVDDTTVYQTIYGFGGSLTDSSALILNNMKSTDSDSYWELLKKLFDPTDGANSAGLSYVRVPLGASDFSATTYSFDDTSGDTSLNDFNINNAPSYLFSVLKDIMSVNDVLRVHLLPWSPPGWMKDGGTMDGGSLQTKYESNLANYILKALQGFKDEGITAFAVSIQNEPQNSNPTYPSTNMPYDVEASIGKTLRTLLDDNGFSDTKLIGYEHNWDNAATYPVNLMDSAASSFDGVAFHCYAGDVSEQSNFTSKYPNKEVFFTECAGTIGTDWWTNIKWYMDNLWIGSLNYGASSGLMWNIALNASGEPKLPGTNSCGGEGCRPIATVNSDGSYSLNEEFYSLAQASKAIIPKDSGGPWGQRVKVTVGGTLNWALVVGAYVTTRKSSSDYDRYSLVVLNWDDGSSSTWNPVSVKTTINFRDVQATVTFPVGVTTLWWYATAPSLDAAPDEIPYSEIYGETASGHQQPMGIWQRDYP
ncbi:glycoside hydrolase family 30 protein [Plicaturopsis crispa FD-325 SS-3]|uniref:Glycoside hydrolase family 30 protein n=1 Tax=Plicaturopsis crispa FD-325 SS-3 TaxID=944288 RepID=A0A0C9SKG2_PLICR|nr:glycoside hydrolase family 30 protein [Plicaturopsis crispa FD-325 SS-3]